MNPIGGFFELELRNGIEYHSDLLALNTGRNALECILRVNKYKRVFIPYFTCDVILEPFKKLNIEYVFYTINDQLEIAQPIENGENEAVLYTNYFGIKNAYVNELSKKIKNLIIDNAQSFFSRPVSGIDTFYSCRKFFGVPDGSYVNLNSASGLPETLEPSVSYNRFSHLVKRIDEGPENAYADFRASENALVNSPFRKMSKLTGTLMKTINYDLVKQKRNQNFSFLHEALEGLNELKCIDRKNLDGPMIYPFLINKSNLKEKLILNRVFVATYWPNVKYWSKSGSFEMQLSENLLALPVDQRYSIEEMKKMLDLILEK